MFQFPPARMPSQTIFRELHFAHLVSVPASENAFSDNTPYYVCNTTSSFSSRQRECLLRLKETGKIKNNCFSSRQRECLLRHLLVYLLPFFNRFSSRQRECLLRLYHYNILFSKSNFGGFSEPPAKNHL